jgi:hypothetical protein
VRFKKIEDASATYSHPNATEAHPGVLSGYPGASKASHTDHGFYLGALEYTFGALES